MSASTTVNQIREQLSIYWLARTEQERRFLGGGAAVALLALIYALAVAPALAGRVRLQKELPLLRQQAAQLQALALEAGELARQTPPPAAPMTRDGLAAGLAARGIKPDSLTMNGDYAKLQLSGVAFANLAVWLDAQRRESRIAVQEAALTALAVPGQVDATLTLRQAGSGAGVQ